MNILFNPHMIWVLLFTYLIYWKLFKTQKSRLWALHIISLALLTYVQPVLSIALYSYLLCTYFCLKYRWGFLWTLSTSLLLLVFAKYLPSYTHYFSSSENWVEKFFVIPLGISYFTFRLIQIAADSQRGLIKRWSFLKFSTFLMFIPTFFAGPMERYQSFYQNHSKFFDRQSLTEGCYRILLGYFKKLVLLELIFQHVFGEFIQSYLEQFPPGLPSFAFVSLMFMKAYIDLSAYTDIAIGLSLLFGFRVTENFNRPLFQRNLAEFWRCWHISLSQWCRNQVFLPMIGWTKNSTLSVYATMLTMGLWHHINLNWLTWGLYHGTGLVLLNRWHRVRRRHPSIDGICKSYPYRLFSRAATFCFVALGYAFVSVSDYKNAVKVFTNCLHWN